MVRAILLRPLVLSSIFAGSAAFGQGLQCSSPNLVQDIQRSLQRQFAPPAIKSIEAIARGQQTHSARVEIVNIDIMVENQNIQKCSASARIWRTDLRQPINAKVEYTIYNSSMVGGFDVVEPR
ncbi:MAG: hypothetical protein AB7G35_05065 [Hyphomicrobiaceae bacterium]